MLIKKVYPALIDTFGNLFPDLMRTSTLDHVQSCPSILRLGSAGGSHKQRVLELPLEVVLFHMVGQSCRDLSRSAVRRIGMP